jgi:hypothetical protein
MIFKNGGGKWELREGGLEEEEWLQRCKRDKGWFEMVNGDRNCAWADLGKKGIGLALENFLGTMV